MIIKTTEDFIKKAKSIYGDNYDYTKSKYVNAKTKIEIKCKKHNHIFFQLSNNHFLSKFPCRYCNADNKRNLFSSNLKEFKALMIGKYGNTLSFNKANYINARTDIILICKKHNIEIKKTPEEFKSSSCNICSKENNDSVRSIEQIKIINNYVSSLGGQLISKKYINNETNLKFKCKNDHVFFESWSDVKNSMRWCKECYPNRYIGETLSRMILEHLINSKMPSSYLKSMNGLQLDGYCKKNKIAFEYQGYQHFTSESHYYDTGKQFKTQKERDTLKKELCIKNGITLIEILQFEVIRKNRIKIFVNQVKQELDNLNIKYTNKPFIPDLIRLYRGRESSLYIKAEEIVKKNNAKIQDYIGSANKHELICINGHITRKSLSVIARDGFNCSNCIIQSKYKILKETIESRGGVLKDKNLKNKGYSELYSWICDSGHQNSSKGQYIINGAWCKYCQYENQTKNINIEDLTRIASDKNSTINEKHKALGISSSFYYSLIKKHGLLSHHNPQDRSKQNISKKTKGRIYQIDPKTFKILKIYSFLEAIRKDDFNNFSPENIRNSFKRNSKAYGYYWCKESEYELLVEKLKNQS